MTRLEALSATVPPPARGRCGIQAMWPSQLWRSASATDTPLIRTVPADGSRKPSITLSSVDFPQPLGPPALRPRSCATERCWSTGGERRRVGPVDGDSLHGDELHGAGRDAGAQRRGRLIKNV